jgi:PAS domain S-box-containing protein
MQQPITPKRYGYLLLGFLTLFGLYLTSLHSYLLFHSLAEIFSIVVAFGIFVIAWNARRFLDNNYLLFIGIAYLFVGALDLIHTLTYTGMGVFQGYETNLPTQLWIAARYMESISLLIAPLLFGRKLKVNLIFLGYVLATSILLLSIFYWDLFPACFIEGVGLTPFKKISEYIISLILLASIVLLLKNQREFGRSVLRWVAWSIIFTIASEVAFTFYVHAYGFSNLIGHFFKIISFYLIYKAIIETGLRRPYDLLFRDLKQSEEALRRSRDELEIRVQERTTELVRTNEELKSEIAQRMRTEDALRKLTQELSERVKEINCLYSVCYYVEKQYSKLEEKLQSIADLIPSGWQYPEIACARIILEGKEYKTDNFIETPWKQVGEIIVHNERIGTVEVCYLEEKPASGEGPFLKEERRLINAIAVELGEMIGHMKSDIALTEQSRISEAFFTSMITPLVFLDRDFNFVRVNQAYAKACQREVSEFPGHNHFEFYPSDAKAIFEQVVETKKPYQAIARPFTFPDHPEWGKTYWDWTLTPILDEAGEVEYLVFSLQDVTERKRVEEAVKAERQRFNDVLEMLPAYLVLLTPDYHVPFANRFFRERFGESRGQRCFEYLFGRRDPCETCETYTVLKTMAPHEWEWTGPDGRNYDVFDFPFTDTDGSTLILEMGIDITERKQAEEALRAASLYTRSLIEASLDPLITISADGKITDVNSATELVTGVPREQLIGSDFSEYFTEPEKAREGYKKVFSEGYVRDYPLAIRHTSGRVTEVLYHATLYRNEAGEVQGVFAAARDITVRKGLQRHIEATNALLNLFVKMRTRKDYLDGVLELVQNWCGCRCAGIRVLDSHGNIPYETYVGFSREFWESENWLSIREHQCACIRVILGEIDPQEAGMVTPGGSFCCRNTARFIENLSEAEKSRYRGVCIQNGFLSVAIVPIRYREKIIGAIHLADEMENKVSFKALEFIESVTPLIGEAVIRFDLEEEVKESEGRLRFVSSELLRVQENERKRISREIHDSLGQSLSAIKFKIESITQQMRESRYKKMAESLETVLPIIQGSIEESRRIQMDLRPSILDDLGIIATLTWFSREFQQTYSDIRIDKEIVIQENEVPDNLKTVIYRISQEALNNIAKHSEADLIHFSLKKAADRIEMTIQDNGRGFDPEETLSVEASRKGLGLTSMRERAELSGGSFTVESTVGKGTIIKAVWPT